MRKRVRGVLRNKKGGWQVKRCSIALILIVTMAPSTATLAQDDEPQLEAFFHQDLPADGLTPRAAENLVDRAFLAMYDLDFRGADADLAQFVAECPNDPRGPAAQAASVLFSVFERNQTMQSEFFTSDASYSKRQAVMPDEDSVRRFQSALDRAEQLASRTLAGQASDEHALFALTLVYGLRADYAALVEHKDLAALRFSEKGNEWARKLLETSPQFNDAYVATGIQRYLVSLRPAPVRWLLRLQGIQGGQDESIRQLELAACNGRYLAPFARILLAVAHLRRQEREPAVVLLTGLRQQFPHNSLFAGELARLQEQMAGAATPAARSREERR